jgi:hypothetical protein
LITATPVPPQFTQIPTSTPLVAEVLPTTESPPSATSPLESSPELPSLTPSKTPVLPTLTPSFTPTFTPNATLTALAASSSYNVSRAPSGVDCQGAPDPRMAAILEGAPDLQANLGCLRSPQPGMSADALSLSGAYEMFERGVMLWVNGRAWGAQSLIYVLQNDQTYRIVSDTFTEGVDPESGGESPPGGLFEPRRGFGKVWRTAPELRDALGWATAPEQADTFMIQFFESGEIILAPAARQAYALSNDGTWRGFRLP